MSAHTQSNTLMSDQTILAQPSLLKRVLLANALFSASSGLIFTFASSQIAEFLGIFEANILGMNGGIVMLLIGVGLLIFSGDLIWLATRPTYKREFVWSVIGADVLWVFGSWALLLSQALPLTVEGSWVILIVADIVLVFALLQGWGWRKYNQVQV